MAKCWHLNRNEPSAYLTQPSEQMQSSKLKFSLQCLNQRFLVHHIVDLILSHHIVLWGRKRNGHRNWRIKEHVTIIQFYEFYKFGTYLFHTGRGYITHCDVNIYTFTLQSWLMICITSTQVFSFKDIQDSTVRNWNV